MLKVRKAQKEDCKVMFDIRNEPQVRQVSFTTEPLKYESHQAWFDGALKNPKKKIFVAENESSKVIGVVRYDLSEDETEAVVSISISGSDSGKGVGGNVLLESEKMLKKEIPSLKEIIARVKIDNEPSIKFFSKYDYSKNLIEFRKEVI